MMEPISGKIFLNQFRVDEMIQHGDVCSRYRGFDVKRNLSLSIKVFPEPLEHDSAVLCFQKDNLALQTSVHPGIVPFFGLYEDQGKSLFIEKYIEGPTLAQILRQRAGTPLPVEDALIYIKALTAALGTVREYGLVHSTVCPANIQATRDGSVLLANFGFARQSDKPMSRSGVFDLPLCQAPEQLRGEQVHPSTDIYALGVLAFEFLTGVHPFLKVPSGTLENDPATAQSVAFAHLKQTPPEITSFNPNLPAALDGVIKIALAKEPGQRFQNAQEMLEVTYAALGVSPEQVPDRIGGRRGSPSTPISDPRYTPPPAYTPPTEVAPAPQHAPISGTQFIPGSSGWVGTQPVAGGAGWAEASGYAPPTSGYVEAKPRRKAWLPSLLIGAAIIALICIAAGAGTYLFVSKGGLATSTPTQTATYTSTATETPVTPPPSPPPPIITEPIVLPPTELPPPTIFIPTQPPPETPTPKRTAFKVTVRNNLSYYVWVYRNWTLMGTDPIPPGKYIWYLNIPAGQHTFQFCRDMFASECVAEKIANVNDDITIVVP